MTLIEKRGKRIFKGENGSGDRRIRHAPTHYDTYSRGTINRTESYEEIKKVHSVHHAHTTPPMILCHSDIETQFHSTKIQKQQQQKEIQIQQQIRVPARTSLSSRQHSALHRGHFVTIQYHNIRDPHHRGAKYVRQRLYDGEGKECHVGNQNA